MEKNNIAFARHGIFGKGGRKAQTGMKNEPVVIQQPLFHLILALGVAALPLVAELPAWATGWCIVLWGYGLAAWHYAWRPLRRWIRVFLFLLGMAAVLASSGARVDGRDFITLLAVMAGLKPLEIRTRRDNMVTVFLAYFLVITCLFNFESLTMTVYLFVSVWVTTGVLIRVNHSGHPFGVQMRQAARLVALAIPFMVVLFLLFPRLSGGFVGAPWNRQGITSLSNTIRMGEISQLASSEEPAFSAFFEGPPPPPAKRYWRGIVFRHFDGQTVRPDRRQTPRRQQPAPVGERLTSYTLVLEPTHQRALFTLDLPVSVSADVPAFIRADHTVSVLRPIDQRFRYQAVSVLDAPHNTESGPDARDLQLPAGYNPRTVALGQQWADAARPLGDQAPEAIAATAMRFFGEGGFLYTLSPGRLQGHSVDAFLFTAKRGYCEHFSVSMTVLMRAAGVPARMVGGYHGGTWNAVGNYLQVRQSHAHVWCEIWVPEKGWVRMDATSVVAPERIGIGIGVDADRLFITRWYETVRDTWEMVNLQWDMWFMGFSAEDQMALLKQLGIAAGRQLQWVAVIVVPLILAGVLVLALRAYGRYHRASEDRTQRVYCRFLEKMARIGLPRASHEGPMDYAESVGRIYPELKPAVDLITWHYVRLRYTRSPGPVSMGDFVRQVREFNPKKQIRHGLTRS